MFNVSITIFFCSSDNSISDSDNAKYSSEDFTVSAKFFKQDIVIFIELFSENMLQFPINENLFKNNLKLSSFARTRLRELYPTICLTRLIESELLPPDMHVGIDNVI